METIRITTSQNVDIDYEIAGLAERIWARLIDLAIFIVLAIIGVVLAIASQSLGESGMMIIIIILVLLYSFYDLVCELTMNGQSVGKRFLKIRVISLDGAQPTIGQYLMRWLFRIIDFTLSSQTVALIAVAVSDKKQRVGDMVAGTIVIKTTPRTAIDQIAFRPADAAYEPVYREVLLLDDKRIELIYEVLTDFQRNGNADLIYSMAGKVKEHIGIVPKEGMHELAFLQTVVKDYSFLTAQ